MRKTIITLFISFLFLSSEAQLIYRHAISFHPDMMFSGLAGTNAYLGELAGTNLKKSPQEMLGYTVGAELAYHFSPAWGAMLQLSNNNYNYVGEPIGNSRLTTSLTMTSLNIDVDVLANLNTLFNEYNKRPTWLTEAFAGVGMAYRYMPNSGTIPPGTFGTVNIGLVERYYVTRRFSLMMKGSLHFIGDSFNNNPTMGSDGSPFDIIPSLSVGFTYHIAFPEYLIYRVKKRYD